MQSGRKIWKYSAKRIALCLDVFYVAICQTTQQKKSVLIGGPNKEVWANIFIFIRFFFILVSFN